MPPALTSSSSSSDSLELTSSPSSKMMCCTYANERMTFCWIVPGPKVGESYGILHKCSMVTFLFTLSLNSPDFTWPKSEDCGGASTPGRFTETWSYPNSWILGMSGNFAEWLAQAFLETVSCILPSRKRIRRMSWGRSLSWAWELAKLTHL